MDEQAAQTAQAFQMEPWMWLAAIVVAIIVLALVILAGFRFSNMGEAEISVIPPKFHFKRQADPSSSPAVPAVTATGPSGGGPGLPAGNPDAKHLLYALERLSDVGEALVAVVEAETWEQQGERAWEWFDMCVENLGSALTTGSTERFRVALWGSTPPDLMGLAYYQFDPATRPEELQDTSIAAKVLRTKQPHYSPDAEKDPDYIPRSKHKRSYKSLYAVPCGRAEEPWGAITVDAKQRDGFSALDQAICQAFAKLATTGASLLDVAFEQMAAETEEEGRPALDEEDRPLPDDTIPDADGGDSG